MSFQQGLSGLNASSKNLEIIGHNIANANTFGTKVSRGEFADMYAAALNGAGTNQVGIGTSLSAVAQQFTQGSITTTENPMDIAINGSGFFQVSNGSAPTTYTRNGQFKIDREGQIVNNFNQQLMGYPVNDRGVIQPGQATPLQLPTGNVPPAVTTTTRMTLNLDSGKAVTAPTNGGAQINFNDATTYNDATSQTFYDAKGAEVAVSYYFQKTGTDTWNVFATANGVPVAGSADDPQPITTITFASDGSGPISPTDPVVMDIPATVNNAGAEVMGIPGVTFDFSRATQFDSSYGVTDTFQDGFAAGMLRSISIETNGVVTATYSNGQSRAAGQIELVSFRNPQGLQPIGENGWARTFASGDPVFGVPGEGAMGDLKAGALEESNIDLTGELVNMITSQRIYQANAQTIKTQDQILQTLVNLR